MIRAGTMPEQVYPFVPRMILANELALGSPLRAAELLARLGVSRTPIREAIGRPAEFGVVEACPNHTARVRRLGAERSGNPVIAREVSELHALTMTIQEQLESTRLESSPGDAAEERSEIRWVNFGEHLAIIATLKVGKPVDCRRAMVLLIRSIFRMEFGLMPWPAAAAANGHTSVPALA